MKVIKTREDSIVIESSNGVQLTITETPKGNLRMTETGRYIKNIHIIPSASNSFVIASTRDEY